MKSVRALALLFALAILPACGTSPMAPESQDPLLEEGEGCTPVMVDGQLVCRGYIGSGS
jgi:hypothetical protein